MVTLTEISEIWWSYEHASPSQEEFWLLCCSRAHPLNSKRQNQRSWFPISKASFPFTLLYGYEKQFSCNRSLLRTDFLLKMGAASLRVYRSLHTLDMQRLPSRPTRKESSSLMDLSCLFKVKNNLSCHGTEGRERTGEWRESTSSFILGGMQELPSIIMKILPFHTILNSPLGRSPEAVNVFSENTWGTKFFHLSSFCIIFVC